MAHSWDTVAVKEIQRFAQLAQDGGYAPLQGMTMSAIDGQGGRRTGNSMVAMTGHSISQLNAMTERQYADALDVKMQNDPTFRNAIIAGMENNPALAQDFLREQGVASLDAYKAQLGMTVTPAPTQVAPEQTPQATPADSTPDDTTTPTPNNDLRYQQGLLAITGAPGVSQNDVTGLVNDDTAPYADEDFAQLGTVAQELANRDLITSLDALSQEQGGGFTAMLQTLLKALGFDVEVTGERDQQTLDAIPDATKLLSNRDAIIEDVLELNDPTIAVRPHEAGVMIGVGEHVAIFDRDAVLASDGTLSNLITNSPEALATLSPDERAQIFEATGIDPDTITIPDPAATDATADPAATASDNDDGIGLDDLGVAAAGGAAGYGFYRWSSRNNAPGSGDPVFNFDNDENVFDGREGDYAEYNEHNNGQNPAQDRDAPDLRDERPDMQDAKPDDAPRFADEDVEYWEGDKPRDTATGAFDDDGVDYYTHQNNAADAPDVDTPAADAPEPDAPNADAPRADAAPDAGTPDVNTPRAGADGAGHSRFGRLGKFGKIGAAALAAIGLSTLAVRADELPADVLELAENGQIGEAAALYVEQGGGQHAEELQNLMTDHPEMVENLMSAVVARAVGDNAQMAVFLGNMGLGEAVVQDFVDGNYGSVAAEISGVAEAARNFEAAETNGERAGVVIGETAGAYVSYLTPLGWGIEGIGAARAGLITLADAKGIELPTMEDAYREGVWDYLTTSDAEVVFEAFANEAHEFLNGADLNAEGVPQAVSDVMNLHAQWVLAENALQTEKDNLPAWYANDRIIGQMEITAARETAVAAKELYETQVAALAETGELDAIREYMQNLVEPEPADEAPSVSPTEIGSAFIASAGDPQSSVGAGYKIVMSSQTIIEAGLSPIDIEASGLSIGDAISAFDRDVLDNSEGVFSAITELTASLPEDEQKAFLESAMAYYEEQPVFGSNTDYGQVVNGLYEIVKDVLENVGVSDDVAPDVVAQPAVRLSTGLTS